MPSHHVTSSRAGAPPAPRTPPRRGRSARVLEPVVTLGLSVLPSTTELVLVRGSDAQGAVLDRVVTTSGDSASANASRLQQTVDAVLQTQALAIAHGYDVHAVGVLDDGTHSALTERVIDALTRAGVGNVTTLDLAVARELFTQLDTAAVDSALASRARTRARRRLIFAVAMLIACAALAFAILDRMSADRAPVLPTPAVTPPPASPAPQSTPALEIPPPPPAPAQQAPPPAPAQEPPPADVPAPVYAPPRRATVEQQPTRRPLPAPPAPPAEPPAPEPAPADNCLFLCGVPL
jgi:hypothetical protein